MEDHPKHKPSHPYSFYKNELTEIRAVLDRDFSASRMNATKWAELINVLSDLNLHYRFKFVDKPDISGWMSVWLPMSTGEFFEGNWPPFRTLGIEWLEINTRQTFEYVPYKGVVIRDIDVSVEVEIRLKSVQVPYAWEGDVIRVVGHVRN